MVIDDWEEVTLGEICTLNYGKALTAKNRVFGKVPVYSSAGAIDWHNENLVESNGIIVGRKGSIGTVFYTDVPFYCIDTAFYILPDDKYDIKYLYYMLKTLNLPKLNGDSAVPGLNRETAYSQKVKLPPLQEQKAIASILSSIDDKIELNNNINKNLEEMAQTIFKNWFVAFEPFKDGEFVESELELIPSGWKVESLDKYVKSIDNRGKTPKISETITNYPIIDVKALNGNTRVIDFNKCMKHVDETTYNTWFRSGHPQNGDILISTVGSLAEMKIFYGSKGCIAQNVVGFRCSGLSYLYLYQYLIHIKNDLISYDIGSVQPSIKVTQIIKHKILVPSDEIVNKFDEKLKPISKMLYDKYLENENLTQLRNTLLPKLMSGEIRVPLKED